MVRLVLPSLFLLATVSLRAQVKATTSDGRQVLLYPDGTWKYALPAAPVAGTSGSRPPTATEKIDLLHGRAAVYYDPAKWHLTKAEEPGRAELEHTDGDGYAVIISERLQMQIDSLRRMVLTNAQSAMPDTRIVGEKRMVVNGLEILELELRGTSNGIQFASLGHYYTGAGGTVQIMTYTSANLLEEFRADFVDLLNGFIMSEAPR